MGTIINATLLKHEKLPNVTVYSWGEAPQVGVEQEVLVEIASGAAIPLHRHSVDARMTIVAGEGVVLSEDRSLQGRKVKKGDVVFFEADIAHGFEASTSGLTFVSKNGGIVDINAIQWDIAFAE
jgi:quercetin dioxygenase-like cupin family protein